MRSWLTRFIAMIFVASMVATPHMTILAKDGVPATPEQAQSDLNDDPNDDPSNAGEDDGLGSEEPSDSSDEDDLGDSESTDGETGQDENSNDGSGAGVDEDDGASEDGNFSDTREEEKDPDGADNSDTDEPGSESEVDQEVESTPEYDSDRDNVLDPETDSTKGENDGEQDEAFTIDGEPEDSGNPSVLSTVFPSVSFPTYDPNTETITIEFTLEEGFEAWEGNNFLVEHGSWEPIVLHSTPLALEPEVDGLIAEVRPGWPEVRFTFDRYFGPLEAPITASVTVPVTVDFPVCAPSAEPYSPVVSIGFWTPTDWAEVEFVGNECAATIEPLVTDVEYNHDLGELWIDAGFVGPPVAGQQLTLTYEQDKLAVDPGPYEVLAFATASDEVFNVGTANANDGLITLDFFDANIPSGLESEFLVTVLLTGWLQGGTCATTGEPEYHSGGELEFVTNTGQSFYDDYDSFVCNLEGPSIVGEWDTDELGQPVIHWTIDTGDLVLYAGVDSRDSLGFDNLVYDCDTLTITNVYGVYTVEHQNCSDSGFEHDFEPQSEEPFRATINVTTALDFDPEFPPLSVVNCVNVWMFEDINPQLISTQASNGLGGVACYEMFLDQDQDGGDVLTKSVDKAEALPGETLTYTVEVSTSTDLWNVIDLSDTLPEGFKIDPDSISCAVAPEMYQVDPCFVQSDSTLRIQVRELTPNPEQPWERQTDPVTITLTYQGEVTGEPGSTLVAEACSVRSYVGDVGAGPEGGPFLMQVEGDQSIVGGGRICDTASTLVLQPDDDEPTETPTQEPTETPTAIPTETATPSTPTPSPTATSEPEEKQTTIRVEMWDGSSIEGASWTLYAPVASQVMAEPYMTGELDSNNTTVLTDLPAGEYRFVVAPEGLDPREFDITVTDEPETIIVQFTQQDTPGTPVTPATPGADADAESEDADAVTGLPSTGQGSSSAGAALFIAAVAASVLMATAFGVRIRSPRA